MLKYVQVYALWYWNYFFGCTNSLDLPKSDDIIPIQNVRGFTTYEDLNFVRDDKYRDLWILTKNEDFISYSGITLAPYTYISIKVVMRKEEDKKCYVIARADQNKEFFEIRDLFDGVDPLVLKEGVGEK